MFRSLAIANYRTWFIGALISNTGYWMQRTAQDWIVLTELTDHDAAAVGIAMALQMAPLVILVPVSGYISDRFDRRTVLTFTNSAMALIAILLGTLVVTGSIQLWHIYVMSAAGGVVAAIENPSKQGFVSELVTSERLSNAVSLNSASFNLARTAGPSIAAGLVLLVGASWVFYINVFTFIAMIVAIRMLDRGKLIGSPRLATWKGSLSRGIRYVRGRPDLLVLFVTVFLIGAFVLNFPIYASTMTTIEFDLGVGQYGILLSCLAAGAVVGALLAARREKPRLAVIAVGAGGLGVALGLAAIMPTYWAFAAALVFAGLAVQTVMATANATVQLTTEPSMRGRVIAIYMAVFMGGTPIGAPTVGWVANAFGPRAAILVGATAAVLAGGVLGIYLLRRRGVGLRFWRGFTRADAVEELELDEAAARRL
jgi:MFS family permease